MAESGRSPECVPSVLCAGDGSVFKKGNFLGKGGFARCYEFIDMRTRSVYAGKVIKKFCSTEKKQMIAQEISIHKSLQHSNIVKIFGAFPCNESICILLELCTRQSLMELHMRRGAITVPEARYFIRHIVSGIAYMHSNNIVHRDLKIANIFLNADLMVKIGDFGLAKRIVPPKDKFVAMCGTPNYIAPEILLRIGYSFEVDIWALGCILYILLVGVPPFETKNLDETYSRIKSNTFEIPAELDPSAAQLIRAMLAHKPEDRPRAADVSSFIFFDGFMPVRLPLSCLTMPPVFNNIAHTSIFAAKVRASAVVFEDNNNEGKQNSVVERENDQFIWSIDIIKSMTTQLLSLDVPNRNFDAEDEAEAPECFPIFWISKWVEYAELYGVGYMLSDNSVGVLFNDNTRLNMDRNELSMQYIDANGTRRFVVNYKKAPAPIAKKVGLIRKFANYMHSNLLKASEKVASTANEEISGLPVLDRWLKSRRAISFHLTDGTFQVNFFHDHCKLLFCPHLRALTIFSSATEAHTYKVDDLARLGYPEHLRKKLQYVTIVLNFIARQKQFNGHKSDENG